MKFIKKLSVLLILLLLGGCALSEKSHEVILKNKRIEYGEEIKDTCYLIKSIDQQKIKRSNIQDNNINQNEIRAVCGKLDTLRIGKQDFVVTVNAKETRLSIEVVDTTPPSIQIDQELWEVETGNPYFDLKKLLVIKDRFDPNPVIGINGTYDLSLPGNYEVEVKAKDRFKNTATKKIAIHVKDKEVKVVEVVTNQPSTSHPSTTPTQKPPATSGGTPLFIPANKQFLFADGLNKNTALSACQEYRNQQLAQSHFVGSASCTILYDAQKEPYGYQATFQ